MSEQEGGILCPNCGAQKRGARAVSLGALKVLRHFQRNSFEAVAHIRLSPAVQRELEALMEGYLTFVLERRLHTPEFIQRVRALLPASAPVAAVREA